ncbi:Anion exchange protein 2 [Oryzias melastigma]|uniref:Anion exchange protein 2 n=1 Tax=Oryzias melastigma TaxID=30732 RepID=A0A834F446_ORYME|nr:Anion exchange protein 2 [Oryzias melastigma]
MDFLYDFKTEAPPPSSLHRTSHPEEEDDGDLNKALGVHRFQQILHPAAAVPDEQHHNYHEEDIHYHRHSSRHTHRPLSKLPSESRRKKSSKKRRKEKDHKSSQVPSNAAIEEGEDEEEEEEESMEVPSAQSESEKVNVEFFLSDDDQAPRQDKESVQSGSVPPSAADSEDASSFSKPASPILSSSPTQPTPLDHAPLARVSSASRSYDLQERRRTGNMTGTEQAKYQRIPTDESEAQMLASAHLDGIKNLKRQKFLHELSRPRYSLRPTVLPRPSVDSCSGRLTSRVVLQGSEEPVQGQRSF